MGFLNDARDYLIKYSEKLVNKTEEYSKIAKLNVDIKRFEGANGKINAEIGDYVIKAIEQGKTDLSFSDQFIAEKSERVKDIKKSIEARRAEIAEIKRISAARKEEEERIKYTGSTSGKQ
jgi:hypothetical protein